MTYESNERVLQFLAGSLHTEMQKDLLSGYKEFTTELALERGRTYVASISHMTQLAVPNAQKMSML